MRITFGPVTSGEVEVMLESSADSGNLLSKRILDKAQLGGSNRSGHATYDLDDEEALYLANEMISDADRVSQAMGDAAGNAFEKAGERLLNIVQKNKQAIDENEFFGAPGGSNGTLNYQTGYGTPASPDNQNPDHFESSNNNKAVNQNSNVSKNAVDSGSMSSKVDALYADTSQAPITPDEVETGIKYELGQQIKKDKRKAKEEVAKNLRKNHKFYSSLGMLNITDKDMINNMSENKQHPNDAPARTKVTANVEETKKIFAEMVHGKDTKYVVNSQICDVMKQMWEQKKARRLGSQ